MPRDFLPVISTSKGPYYIARQQSDEPMNLHQNVDIVEGLDGQFMARARSRYTRNASDSTDDASTARGRGIITFQGTEIIVDEDTLNYQSGTQALSGGTDFYDEYTASFVYHKQTSIDNLVTVNAGHPSTHASAKHGNVWYSAVATSAPTRISDADMPGNNGVSITRGGASLDGYFFLCDVNGQIHNSDLNDFTAWTATNFLTAEREADIGVYLGKHHDNLVYIGTSTIEFFYNAGNATGSPLQRRQDIAYRVGCVFPNSIVEVGDVIYFLGVSEGETRMFKLANFQLTEVSSGNFPIYARILSNSPGALTELEPLEYRVYCAYVVHQSIGPQLYVSSYLGWTFVINLDSGITTVAYVAELPTYTGGIGAVWVNAAPIIMANAPEYLKTVWSNGAVCSDLGFTGNDTAAADLNLTTTPTRRVYFPPWDAGTNKKKRITRLSVVGYPAATSSATYDDADLKLTWVDFDKTITASIPLLESDFTNERTINFNTANGNRLYRCGTTRQRMHRIEFTDNGVAQVGGLIIEYDIVE